MKRGAGEVMFRVADAQLTPRRLRRYADEAVRVFFAAYGPRDR